MKYLNKILQGVMLLGCLYSLYLGYLGWTIGDTGAVMSTALIATACALNIVTLHINTKSITVSKNLLNKLNSVPQKIKDIDQV